MKFLIRIDDFPTIPIHEDVDKGKAFQFVELFEKSKTHVLLGVVGKYVDEALLDKISKYEYCSFALHGYEHEEDLHTRPMDETVEVLKKGLEAFQGRVAVDVFVPPANHVSDSLVASLRATGFKAFTGGPGSIEVYGVQPVGSVIGGLQYYLSLPPLYGRSKSIISTLPRLINTDIPYCITLHWTWENADDETYKYVKVLIDRLKKYEVIDWKDQLT